MLALVLGIPARAPTAPAPENWGTVETVEVKAAPGPAVWRLTRGSSEVWILGTVSPMPKGMEWNKTYLADLLDGARAILMPPRGSVGLFEGGWFLLMNGSKLSLPSGQTLEPSLPDAVRARFVAARTSIGRAARRYDTDTALRAAVRLQSDFRDFAKLDGSEPGETIESLAHDKHVPAKPVSQFEVLDAFKEALALPAEQQQTCLAAELDDVERQGAHAAIAARAWAVGDIKMVKANYAPSRFGDCVVAAVHHFSDLDARSISESVAAIEAALDQPGKTIAVVGIGPLLRQNGVLERLKARHIAIEGPAD